MPIAALFCCDTWLKNAIVVVRVDTWTAVEDLDANGQEVLGSLRTNIHVLFLSRSIGCCVEGVFGQAIKSVVE